MVAAFSAILKARLHQAKAFAFFCIFISMSKAFASITGVNG